MSQSNGTRLAPSPPVPVVDCARFLTHRATASPSPTPRFERGKTTGMPFARCGSSTALAGCPKSELMLAQLDPDERGGSSRGRRTPSAAWKLPRWIPQVNVYDAHDRFLGAGGRATGRSLGVAAEADGRGKYLGDVDPARSRPGRRGISGSLEAGEREVGLRGCGLGPRPMDHQGDHPAQLVARAPMEGGGGTHGSTRHPRHPRPARCCYAPVTSCDLARIFGSAARPAAQSHEVERWPGWTRSRRAAGAQRKAAMTR